MSRDYCSLKKCRQIRCLVCNFRRLEQVLNVHPEKYQNGCNSQRASRQSSPDQLAPIRSRSADFGWVFDFLRLGNAENQAENSLKNQFPKFREVSVRCRKMWCLVRKHRRYSNPTEIFLFSGFWGFSWFFTDKFW